MVSGFEIAGTVAFVPLIAKLVGMFDDFCNVDERYQLILDDLCGLARYVETLEIIYGKTVIHSLLTNNEEAIPTGLMIESIAALIETLKKAIILIAEQYTSAFELKGPGAVNKFKKNGRKAWKVMGGVGTAKMGSFMDHSHQIHRYLTEINLLLPLANSVLGKSAPRTRETKLKHQAFIHMGKAAAKAYGIKDTDESYQQLLDAAQTLRYHTKRIGRDNLVEKISTLCTVLPEDLEKEAILCGSCTEASLPELKTVFTDDTKSESTERLKAGITHDSSDVAAVGLKTEVTHDTTTEAAEELNIETTQKTKKPLPVAVMTGRTYNLSRIAPTYLKKYRQIAIPEKPSSSQSSKLP